MTGGGALDRMPIGAAVLTPDRVMAVNRSFAQVLRTAPGQVDGSSLTDLLAPDAASTVRELMGAAPAAGGHGDRPDDGHGGGATPWHPVAGIAPDGAPWTGQLALGGAVESDGASGHLALLVPGSPALVVEGHEVDPAPPGPPSSWATFELDRVLSHDARGGLRGVKSFLTLLERELGDGLTGQAAEFFATAATAAARTDQMLERLVVLLRLAARPVVVAPVSLDDIVSEAAARTLDLLPGPPADLRRGDLPMVWGNRALLVDAFAELLTNARKFAAGRAAEDDRDGRHDVVVRLAAEVQGPWVEVSVDDDGPGIEAGLAEDAFAPFRLLQPKGRYPGVGMGLPIVRETVRAQGGRCWVVEHEPPGTWVRVRLARAGA